MLELLEQKTENGMAQTASSYFTVLEAELSKIKVLAGLVPDEILSGLWVGAFLS